MLTVTIERLDDPSVEPVVVEIGDASDDAFGSNAYGGESYFWASGIPLPSAGRYRLTAIAPEHQGCFELNVSAATG